MAVNDTVERLAFDGIENKEIAKAALRAAGITIGSELRRGDPGWHGANQAIDIPAYPNFGKLGASQITRKVSGCWEAWCGLWFLRAFGGATPVVVGLLSIRPR